MPNNTLYRPNVGIIIVNSRNQVFWAKRVRETAWQFPQGGIDENETPEDAMYRELFEETGLLPEHISILGRTSDWLQYDIPAEFNQSGYCHYRGQKQIWFLVLLTANESFIRLSANKHPEFDDWCWCDYWEPTKAIIDFKKSVYVQALKELSKYLHGIEPYAVWSLRQAQADV